MRTLRGGAATRRARVLLASVVIVATSGMVYELVAGTVAGYFLGNAVTEFALVLGVYLSAMGAGATLSTRLAPSLLERFVEVELLVAVVGGTSAATLFAAHAHGTPFRLVLYGDVFTLGALVGVELPLLLRLLREELGFRETVVQGLTFDYVGSLAAAVLFPLALVPLLGLVRTAALFGVVNALVAGLGASLIAEAAPRRSRGVVAGLVTTALLVLFAYGDTVARATAD